MVRRSRSSSPRVAEALVVAWACGLSACSWDWDRFEPRGTLPSAPGPAASGASDASVPTGARPDASRSDAASLRPGACREDRARGVEAGSNLLRAWWRLDEGMGQLAADSSGFCFNAELMEGASWQLAGRLGRAALQLDARRPGWAEVTDPAIDTSRPYSVAAWVKLNLERPDQVHTFVSIDGIERSAFFLQHKSALFLFRVTESTHGGNETIASAAEPVASQSWHHVAGIYDGEFIRLYVDGVLQDEQEFLTPWQAMGSTAIGRGRLRQQPDDFVTGAIDEVRLYQGVLSQATLSELAEAPPAE